MIIRGKQTTAISVEISPEELYSAVEKYVKQKHLIPPDAWISDGYITQDGYGGSHSWDDHIRLATQEDKDVMTLLKDLKEYLK